MNKTVSAAAVSCSPDAYTLGGVGLGIWLTGKPGRAWHRCMALLAVCMGFGVGINDVVYYLDFGVVGLVKLT